jgi:hypothetical protein
MTAWRTNPDLPLSSARDLAEKYKDLGWRRLYRSEQRRIRENPDAVCQHLAPQHIKSLAEIHLSGRFRVRMQISRGCNLSLRSHPLINSLNASASRS